MMMSFESLRPFAMSTMKVTTTGTMGTAGKRKIWHAIIITTQIREMN